MILNAYASPAEHRTAIAISSFIVYICKRERERERERERNREEREKRGRERKLINLQSTSFVRYIMRLSYRFMKLYKLPILKNQRFSPQQAEPPVKNLNSSSTNTSEFII